MGTEWYHGDSDPVRGSLGPPEMVSVAHPGDPDMARNVSLEPVLPGGVCGHLFFFLSNLEGVEH